MSFNQRIFWWLCGDGGGEATLDAALVCPIKIPFPHFPPSFSVTNNSSFFMQNQGPSYCFPLVYLYCVTISFLENKLIFVQPMHNHLFTHENLIVCILKINTKIVLYFNILIFFPNKFYAKSNGITCSFFWALQYSYHYQGFKFTS